MKLHAVLLACLLGLPGVGNAGVYNLATFTCDSYVNQILNPAPMTQVEDAVDFSMWLFGFAIGRSGDHSIYSNGLQSFGNALDAGCRSSPGASLLEAIASINPSNSNPMDLRDLDCATFWQRQTDMARDDADGARTIMMWLFGFTVGKSGGHVLDTGAVGEFGKTLSKHCTAHPKDSLFDALTKVRMP